MRAIRALVVAAALAGLVIAAPSAHGQTLTWDPNGTANVNGFSDGSGTWDTVTGNWWYGTLDSAWGYGDTAQFSSGAGGTTPYTITLGSGVTAGGIIFQNQNYTVTGNNTLTLSGNAPTVTVNAGSATIDSALTGSAGLTVTGPGLLTLGAANNYPGTTAITGGTLALDFTQAGAPAANILPSGAPVVIGIANFLGQQNSLAMISSGGTSTQTLSGVTLAAVSGLDIISANGGTLNLGAITTPLSNSSSASFGNYVLFKVQNGAVLQTSSSNDANSNAGLIAGRNFGGFGVIDTISGGADNFGFAGVANGVIQPAATTAWTSGANTNTVNYFLNSSGTTTTNAVIASLNIAPTSNNQSLYINGGGAYKIRGGIMLQGPNSFTISTTNSTSSMQNPANEDWPIWVMGSGNLTLAVPFVDNGASPTSTNPSSAGSISKLGPGTLIVTASCNATGATYLDQGTIQLAGSAAALPSGSLYSAANTSLIANPGAGNMTQVIGGGGAINGNITISSGSLELADNFNGSIAGPGALVIGGNAGGAGTVTLTSTAGLGGISMVGGAQTNFALNTGLTLTSNNTLGGQMYVGNNGGSGTLTVSGGTFNVGSWFEVGRLYGSTASNTSTSTCTISGSGTVVNTNTAGGSGVEIGWANGSGGVTTGILNVINGATFNSNNSTMYLGQSYNGGSGQVGIVTVGSGSSDTAYVNLGGGNLQIGNNPGASGTLTVKGGSVTCGEFYAGNNGGTGNVIISGGTLTAGSWFEIGRLYGSNATTSTTSSVTITGPGTTVIHQNNGSHAEIGWSNGSGGVADGILNVSNGATFNTNNSEIHLGVNYNGGSGQVGTVVLGSNSADTAYINTGNGNFFIGDANGSTGNLTVNGGSLSCWDLRTDSGNGNFTLNAGLVTATGWIRPGINAGSVAIYTVNGGTLMNSNIGSTGGQNNDLRLNIGENGTGTLTINGGLVRMSNPGNSPTSGIYVGGGNGGDGTGTLNIYGGTLSTVDPQIYAGANAEATGTISMNSGRVFNTGGLVLGNGFAATGTLNLNGGLFQTNSVINNGGNGSLYFNGGTLQISGNNGSIAAQNGGNLNVYVGQTGAVIDTNGNNIQALVPFIPSPLNSGTDGGLIKLGAGVLAINASNGQSTYQGPTQVSAGALLVTGGLPNTSNINVASGATFGGDGATSSITLAASSTLAPGYTYLNPLQVGTISPATLTSNGGVLSFKLSNTAASGNDQVDVTGNVSLTNVTFNISNLLNGALQSGSYDLLSYGSSSSLSGLTLTGLPLSRQTYKLDTTSVPNEILLDVSAASPGNLVWLGTNGTTWNTSTLNWYNTSAGSVDKFYNLDNVSFTDQGAAHGNISIASGYSIGALNVSLTSAASSYTFSGPGYLTGVAGLVMTGSGSVTIDTPNNLTGETDLHGGNLTLGASGAIGDASGTNVTYIGGPSVGDSASVAVHSGGTLSGASIVLGYASASTGALTQNGGVVNVVSGSMTVGSSGAGIVSQSGGVVNISAWLRLGEGSSGTGVVNVSGGTVNVGQMAYVGEMGGGTLSLSGNAVMNVGQNVQLGMPVDNTSLPGSGVLNVSGNAVLSVSGEMGVGRGGGTGIATIGNNASVTVGSTIDVGDSNNNSVSPNINFGTSSGTLIQTGGTLTATGGQLWVGQYDLPNVNSGVYNFSGGVLNMSQFLVVGNNGGTGVMNMSGSAILNTSGEVHIGDGGDIGPSSGTLNLSGGVMNVNNWFVVGRFGAAGLVNMTGGSITQQNNGNFDVAVGNGALGTFNQSGGTVNVFGQLLVPESGNGSTVGTYNLSGSGLVISNNWLAVGRDGGTGYFNLSGGTLEHTNNNYITIGSGGTGVFTMTGGLLVDSAPSAFVGESSAGTLSIAGGAAHFNQLAMGVNAGNSGTVDLSGGLLSTTGIFLNNASSTATLHLAGGTLQAASGASANFMSGLTAAYLDSGMTTIDTNSQTVTVGQPLLAGSGSGGLSKVGAGMLTLAGASTYAGPTVVSAGTLQLGLGGLGNGSLAHRWSFDQGTSNDSVGGANAVLFGNAALGTGGVTIAGNGSSGVNYVSLGNGSTNILPTTNSPYTIQVWATQNGIESWSRIWDFGNAQGTNNLLWSWTNETNTPGTFAVNGGASNNTAAFGTGTEYNMTLTATPGTGGVGTTYDWYVYSAAGGLVGSGSVATAWDISQMTQANMWLGRSEYPDNDANATYSEVRIFDTAFAPSQVAALNAAGPSATLGVGPILPTATAVTIAPNATLDLDGGSQQIASLNDAAPGMGGSVINSNTSSAVTLTLSPTGGIAKFSGSIEDSGAPGSITLVLDGPGTQILSGSNTYSGGTVVTEGTLILASPYALADGSSLTVGQGASSLFAPAFAPSSVSASPAIAATVPEPGTLLLLLAALGCAAACRRAGRRGNQTQ